jgi:hypothetical protein
MATARAMTYERCGTITTTGTIGAPLWYVEGADRMREHDLAELQRRLDAGEWLRPGEVAALLETTRASIDRWIRAGRLGYRSRGPGGHRVINPDDVRKELDAYRQEHRGPGS